MKVMFSYIKINIEIRYKINIAMKKQLFSK